MTSESVTRDQPATPSDPPPDRLVLVDPDDLPAFCPNPQMPLWSTHPRVYLELSRKGEAMCAYCGTVYRLADRSDGSRRDGRHEPTP